MDGGVKVAFGSIIIHVEVGEGLRMTKFTKGDADWDSVNAMVVKSLTFCFSSRCHDGVKSDTFSEDYLVRRGCRKGSIGRGVDD